MQKNGEKRLYQNAVVTEFSSSWEEEYPNGEVVGKKITC